MHREAEFGKSAVGNFGQWNGHNSFSDLNSNVNQWGWTYAGGSTNAPHTGSSQWYRCRLSLGDAYGHNTDGGDYWMELALPRYSRGSSGGMFTRTCEAGTIGSWESINTLSGRSATPSCQAYNAQGQMISGNSIAAFSSTRFNVGSHYNTSNGRFTAPVTGRYLVAYSGLHDNQGQGSTGFEIRINNSTTDGLEGYANNPSQIQLAKTAILSLSANDYVSIFVRRSGTRVHQRYGSFSVSLLN